MRLPKTDRMPIMTQQLVGTVVRYRKPDAERVKRFAALLIGTLKQMRVITPAEASEWEESVARDS